MFTVAPHYQIMEQLGLKDLSRKLVTICTISYFLAYIEYFMQVFKHSMWQGVKFLCEI